MHNKMKVKNQENLNIEKYLHKLNYSQEEIKVYFILLQSGPSTILEASRLSGVERTKIYRFLEEDNSLIEELTDHHKKIIRAVSVEIIQFRLEEKRALINSLSKNFPSFSTQLQSLQKIDHSTSVKFYRGKDGIKQMLWHEASKARKIVHGFTYHNLLDIVDHKFVARFINEFNKRKITLKEIRSSEYKINRPNHNSSSKKLPKFIGDNIRYIDPQIINIKAMYDIYNDTISISTWHNNEIFGIELVNPIIADMQRQMFDIFWNLSFEEKPSN